MYITIHSPLSLADLGGRAGHMPLLRVQILSFSHTNFAKRNRLGSPRPLRGPRPSTGNPGSATDYLLAKQEEVKDTGVHNNTPPRSANDHHTCLTVCAFCGKLPTQKNSIHVKYINYSCVCV